MTEAAAVERWLYESVGADRSGEDGLLRRPETREGVHPFSSLKA